MYLLHAADQAQRNVEGELQARLGLSLAKFEVLYQISSADRQATMTELAAALLTSNSGITRLIDDMVRQGLLSRQGADHDRRVILVRLTGAGEDMLAQAEPAWGTAVEDHIISRLSADQVNLLVAALRALTGIVPGH